MAFSFFSNDKEFQKAVLRRLDAIRIDIDGLYTRTDIMNGLIYQIQNTQTQGEELMSKIFDAVKEHSDKMDVFFGRLDTGLTGLAGDVDVLKNMIADLQNATTDVDLPADAKALLDGIETHAGVIADRVETLDGLTPPPPVVVPVEPAPVEPTPPVEPTV